MATIEYLNKRIEGKKKEIEKLTKKLDRINKAAATGWTVNPYYYHESDLKWTARDLEQAKEMLANYEADLKATTEKANSRNVTVIIEFLEQWKARVSQFYHDALPRFEAAHDELLAEIKELEDRRWGRSGKEKIDANTYWQSYGDLRREFNARWGFLRPYLDRGEIDEKKLAHDLKIEAEAKYDDIIERTNKYIGEITDASSLSIGEKGDLNGIIIGERGRVKVNTIGAGGYNIQCYHFRTLIHKIA